MKRIGFIGFGEVGYEMSKGFKEEGNIQVIAFDPLYKESFIQNRAKEVDVTLVDQPKNVIKKVDMVIVAVPANKTWNVWEGLKEYLKSNVLYVDVTTADATTKQKISKEVVGEDKKFIDAALMGPLPIYKHKVPIIASGRGVGAFVDQMGEFNMNIEKISDEVGDATNIKFVRSIFMKGMASLLYEVLDIADHLNVGDNVIHSISETLDSRSFEQTVTRLVSGTAIHSERRMKEMENVINLITTNNKHAHMSKATLDKLRWISKLGLKKHFNSKAPDDWKLVFNKINEER
ncbi:prephenate dehydrogenase/arogenate dehydrogenase family protein [Aquibacillus sediminis]|uniref:prephenate dehydrogenase/arogenate dehydrogenase family protein n=1 Tax=Aquibacillus sediminis TaxID=2574734 RepID=UPI001108BE57|nr:prephenate dehydrogenase/arogenate dehydrogenase family protein [Aquibacillus sediminis]